jgi:hypothetical protein
MSFSAKDYYLCTLYGGTEIFLEREWEMGGESWKRVGLIPKTIKGYNPEILGESENAWHLKQLGESDEDHT